MEVVGFLAGIWGGWFSYLKIRLTQFVQQTGAGARLSLAKLIRQRLIYHYLIFALFTSLL